MGLSNKKILNYANEFFETDLKNLKVVDRITGGMSNFTYIIEYEKKLYTVRIPGEHSENFVNRECELISLNIANMLGITAKTYYFNTDNGVKISEYIQGEVLTYETINKYINEINEILHKIHNVDSRELHLYNPLKRLSKYIILAAENNPKYDEIYDWWKNLYETKYSKIPMTFCHGDIQPSNFVVKEDGEVLLLDWEFAGVVDPLYDVTGYGIDYLPNALKMLPIYLDRKPTEDEIFRVKYYYIYQALQWHKVAVFKHKVGLSEKLKIDFSWAANLFLDMAYNTYQELKG